MHPIHRLIRNGFIALGCFVAASLFAVDDQTVTNTTYTGTATVTSTNTISTSGTVTVTSGANVTFSTGTRVSLEPGFTAASGSSFHAVVPDLVPPDVPAGLTPSAVNTSSFAVGWSPSSDGGNPAALYEVFLNGVSQVITGAMSINFTGLAPGSYAVTVRARDAAGNWSAVSAPLTINTATDSDNDGVPDYIESQLGTNPNSAKQADSSNSTLLKITKPQ